MTLNLRQQRIVALLDRHPLSSQAQIVGMLSDEGIAVTQATVSRDLERIGAVRVRRAGNMVYAVPEDEPDDDPFERLRTALGLVRSMEAAANLLVLRTAPGNGMPVARAFDVADLDHVAGTIGGDDTVLLIAREPRSGRDLADLCTRVQGGGDA